MIENQDDEIPELSEEFWQHAKMGSPIKQAMIIERTKEICAREGTDPGVVGRTAVLMIAYAILHARNEDEALSDKDLERMGLYWKAIKTVSDKLIDLGMEIMKFCNEKNIPFNTSGLDEAESYARALLADMN